MEIWWLKSINQINANACTIIAFGAAIAYTQEIVIKTNISQIHAKYFSIFPMAQSNYASIHAQTYGNEWKYIISIQVPIICTSVSQKRISQHQQRTT